MKDINLFAAILSLGNQKDKKSFLINHFKAYEQKQDDYGNLYISRDFSKTQPFVCSHIDTVDESSLSKTVIYDEASGILTAERDGIQCNLGADDGVGVWACIELFNQHDIGLAFFLDEEVGCIGSSNADPSILENASYLIQLDRKGNNDIIFNTHYADIASNSFIDDLIPVISQYNYKRDTGGMTDVVTLVERGIVSVSACNLSCGYYKPHSQEEYIIIDDMNNAIALASDIIINLGNTVYPFQSSKHMYEESYFDYTPSSLKEYLMDLANSDLSDDDIIEKLYLEVLC